MVAGPGWVRGEVHHREHVRARRESAERGRVVDVERPAQRGARVSEKKRREILRDCECFGEFARVLEKRAGVLEKKRLRFCVSVCLCSGYVFHRVI